MRATWLCLALLLLAACGGADADAEASWETHTTAEEDGSAGGEEAGADDAPTDE
jgi:hypothetical protein